MNGKAATNRVSLKNTCSKVIFFVIFTAEKSNRGGKKKQITLGKCY